MAAAAAGFVEFHQSMSLEHQAIPPPLPEKAHRKRVAASVSYHASPHVTAELSTVDQVLECRNELWEHVEEILESVTGEMSSAMAAAVDKTKQLKKLHAICHAREQHVHTIKLGLMHERNEYLAKLIAIQALLRSRTIPDPSTLTTLQNDVTDKHHETCQLLLQVLSNRRSPHSTSVTPSISS